jgi:hypothetical protein
MKTLTKLAVFLFIALLGVNESMSQTTMMTQMTAADLFKSLKIGQWVEIEGTAQSDMSLVAKKVKLLTGDFQDDDWEIKGKVRSVDPAKKQFQVLRIPVSVNADSEYESPEGTFKSFSDLKPGMLVECEGTFLKDGTFSAEEVQQETDFKPNELNELRAVGKVEKLDPLKRTVAVIGATFKIVDVTKVQSAVK